jgi:type I restriction enzyme S subunit
VSAQWPAVPLGHVCEVVSGATPRTHEGRFWGGDILWATPKDLGDLETAYLEHTPRKITNEGLRSCAASILPPNSVLLSSRAPIGLVAINSAPMATNQGFKSLIPDRRRVESKFLFHWLKYKTLYLQGLGNGATFKEISKAVVERIEIPLPPLDEQRRIAAILDKADALRRKRKRALDLLDKLPRSIYSNVIESSVHLSAEVGEFAKVMGGKRLPKGHDYCIDDTGYKYLRVTDIQKEHLRRTDLNNLSPGTFQAIRRYVVNKDDVVITIAGTIGLTRHIDVELAGVNLTENAAKIVIQNKDLMDPVFLTYALQSDRTKKQVSASIGQVTIGKLALFKIQELKVAVPKIEQQRKFRRILTKHQKIRSEALRLLIESERLFSCLQHRAFTGQL